MVTSFPWLFKGWSRILRNLVFRLTQSPLLMHKEMGTKRFIPLLLKPFWIQIFYVIPWLKVTLYLALYTSLINLNSVTLKKKKKVQITPENQLAWEVPTSLLSSHCSCTNHPSEWSVDSLFFFYFCCFFLVGFLLWYRRASRWDTFYSYRSLWLRG